MWESSTQTNTVLNQLTIGPADGSGHGMLIFSSSSQQAYVIVENLGPATVYLSRNDDQFLLADLTPAGAGSGRNYVSVAAGARTPEILVNGDYSTNYEVVYAGTATDNAVINIYGVEF